MFLNVLDRNSSVINTVVSRRIAGMYTEEEILQSQPGDIQTKESPGLPVRCPLRVPHLSCKKVEHGHGQDHKQ